MPDSYLIIYNARPGSRAGAAAERLSAALEERGFEAELWPTARGVKGMDAVDPARHRAVLIVGGDGTLHHVVNGLRPAQVPLGFLGTGTINVMSRELKLPREPGAFADMVVAGNTIVIPALRANTRCCALFLEAGFLGSVVSRVNEHRARTGRHGQGEFLRYGLPAVARSWGRPLRVTLQLDGGGTVERRYSNVLLTRARLYAGKIPMPVHPGIEQPLSDRSFESIGYRTATPPGHLTVLTLGFLRLLRPLKGLLRAAGFLECLRATSARIEGPEGTASHVDAETLGEMPIEFFFADESFSFLVPAPGGRRR